VIAGQDFGGGGKSIEHPIVAMKGAGIGLIIAESFSRYTYRNSINLGLPAIKCEGITQAFKTGDEAAVNVLTGEIKNLTTGKTLRGCPLTDFVLGLVESGGLLEYYKKRLAQ
jgi:3-isopropylmalate/(R)-2-methylmalate dehydratase small subunit